MHSTPGGHENENVLNSDTNTRKPTKRMSVNIQKLHQNGLKTRHLVSNTEKASSSHFFIIITND